MSLSTSISFSPPEVGDIGVFLLLDEEAPGGAERDKVDAEGFAEGGRPPRPARFGGGISSTFGSPLAFDLTTDCVVVEAAADFDTDVDGAGAGILEEPDTTRVLAGASDAEGIFLV